MVPDDSSRDDGQVPEEVMTPEELAAQIAYVLSSEFANSSCLVSDAYGNEFYVDVHQPGEGNQRFSVTVADCTDIRT